MAPRRHSATEPGGGRPAVTVEVALLSVSGDALHTLVRSSPDRALRGRMALPGGPLAVDESLDDGATRILAAECSLRGVFLEQLYTFGDPRRDPRARTLAVAYYALVDPARFAQAAADTPGLGVARLAVPWEGEVGGPVELFGPGGRLLPPALDHAEILGMAVRRLRGKLDYAPIGFQLLPERFTLLELQRVHEAVLGRGLNKDSFRRRMLASGRLEATGQSQRDVGHRPAELYRFARRSAV